MTRRSIIVLVITLVILMGLPVLTPAMSTSMQSCSSCWVVILMAISLVMRLMPSNLGAREPMFAALCHPLPPEPPPRTA